MDIDDLLNDINNAGPKTTNKKVKLIYKEKERSSEGRKSIRYK
jgi:hypothetical protein